MEETIDRDDDFVLLALGRQYVAASRAASEFDNAGKDWEKPVSGWLELHSSVLDTRVEALLSVICMQRARTPSGALLQMQILEVAEELSFEDMRRQRDLERMRSHAMFSVAQVLVEAGGLELEPGEPGIESFLERQNPFIEDVAELLALYKAYCREYGITFRQVEAKSGRAA